MVVCARQFGVSISETIALLRLSCTTLFSAYTEWSKKDNIFSERQLSRLEESGRTDFNW